MKKRRLISAVMAAALTLSLAQPLAAGAANSSFSDISDQNTAVNADILRLMGVVSGTGSNQFDPSGGLTRAQFSTMVVNFMQKGDQVPIHTTRTIFSDVTGTHWARGYVNLAASLTVKDGEEELPLISGVGNGQFRPDDPITLAQAATILIRVLGYTSAQAGAVWPQSYMNLAGSIGLSDGLPADYNAPLTRAQAAQLFVNALRCKTAGGEVYYTSLGEVTEDTIVLAVNVQTDDGSATGAIRTTQSESAESYLPANGQGDVYALQGKRGAQVLNDKGEIVTFVPDDSNAITITLSGDAQASYVRGTNGQQYTISSTTPVYTSAQGDGKNYVDSYTTLYSGTQLTMYSERGKIVAVYASGGGTTIDSDAVVVLGDPSVATFHQLTGGATNFTIMKNRQTIRLSDIEPYDVVTYDQINNTLVVSDLRMTCVYQNAVPTVSAPETIDVLGNKFDVLQSAWDTTRNFRLGDTVTLLFTADGKVAGMAAPSAQTRSTAVGLVDGGSATVFLPNGGTLELTGTVSNASSLEGQLVIFSGGKSQITASRLSENRAPGPFDVADMYLGDHRVSNGVRIFEKVTTSAMVAINRADLTMGEIPANQISGYHLDSAGMVDYIVLNNVTGDAYEYGMMTAEVTTTEDIVDETTGEVTTPGKTTTTWTLKRGIGEDIKFSPLAGYNGRAGDIIGVVASKNRSGDNMIRTILELTRVDNVSPGDFFDSQGVPHVTVNGRTYRVADDVECYGAFNENRITEGTWFTQPSANDRLNAVKAFSSDLTVYIDPVGEKVRVIVAH